MSFANAAQYAAFIAVVTALVRPIGGYLERVFSGAPTAGNARSTSDRPITAD